MFGSEGFAGRGRPPLARPPPAPSNSSANSVASAASSSSSGATAGTGSSSSFNRMNASTPNASSTSLNSSRHAPFEPNPDIQTPLRDSQRMSEKGQSSHLQWQQSNNFGSQASSRRPSESSMDSDLHPHNLDSQPYEYMHSTNNRQQSEPSARYGPPPQPSMATTSGQRRSVYDDISMPTVESILASQYRTTPTGAHSQYQGGNNPNGGLSSHLFANTQPMPTNQTTRNSFQPSFADYNHHQIAHASAFGAGSSGSILNSVAASPSLVSALHALQKRCRQLEEDNQVLRENVAKESRAHADSRGTCQ